MIAIGQSSTDSFRAHGARVHGPSGRLIRRPTRCLRANARTRSAGRLPSRPEPHASLRRARNEKTRPASGGQPARKRYRTGPLVHFESNPLSFRATGATDGRCRRPGGHRGCHGLTPVWAPSGPSPAYSKGNKLGPSGTGQLMGYVGRAYSKEIRTLVAVNGPSSAGSRGPTNPI